MAAVAAGCRKALVNARWAIVLLSSTNELLLHCRDSISDILGSFQSGGALSIWSEGPDY